MESHTVDRLVSLGLTPVEAKTYCVLVAEGDLGGYQIARILNLARSSVYPALDSLCARGFARHLPGETSVYCAVPPEEAIGRLEKDWADNARRAREGLVSIAVKGGEELFANIRGKTNLLARARTLIGQAQREIIMNMSMSLDPLEDSLRLAASRGVRIILFSWKTHDIGDLPVEFYCPFDSTDWCAEERILLASDASVCVIGSNDSSALIPHRPIAAGEKLPADDADFLGMTTSNRLMVNLVLEHIHFDIYLLKLRKKYGYSPVTADISIGSLMEKGV